MWNSRSHSLPNLFEAHLKEGREQVMMQIDSPSEEPMASPLNKSPTSHPNDYNHLRVYSHNTHGMFQPLSPCSAATRISHCVALLPAEQFFPLAHFQTEQSMNLDSDDHVEMTQANPFPLPSPYAEAVLDSRQRAIAARQMIDDAHLTPEQQLELQSRINSQFQIWLKSTYSHHYLVNLLRPTINEA